MDTKRRKITVVNYSEISEEKDSTIQVEEFSPEYFDQASDIWRRNKKSSYGMFSYKCCWIGKNNKRCCAKIYNGINNIDNVDNNINRFYFCRRHINEEYDEDIHTWN